MTFLREPFLSAGPAAPISTPTGSEPVSMGSAPEIAQARAIEQPEQEPEGEQQ